MAAVGHSPCKFSGECCNRLKAAWACAVAFDHSIEAGSANWKSNPDARQQSHDCGSDGKDPASLAARLNDATTHATSMMPPPTATTIAVGTASDCPGVTSMPPRAPSPIPMMTTVKAAAHRAQGVERRRRTAGAGAGVWVT